MAKILGLEWNGDFVSNTWTAASPSLPVGQALTRNNDGAGILTLASAGDMRAFGRSGTAYSAIMGNTLDASARLQYTGGALLALISPAASGQQFLIELRRTGGGSNGYFYVRRNSDGTTTTASISWTDSSVECEFTTPAAPYWLWVRLDPTNATGANRLQVKAWQYGGEIPGSWTAAGSVSGVAATSGMDELATITLLNRDSSEAASALGLMVVDNDPDADMSAYLPASGATLTTATATSITQTTATIGCTTDSATGTLYAVVTTSATAPSAAQVEAGQDHTGSAAVASGSNASLTADVNNTINVTGLTADTTYYSHFVQDEGTAEYSNVLSSTSWATLEAAPILTDETAVSIGTTTVTPRVTTDTGNGTAYFVVTLQSESEPSNTQIAAGQNAAGENPISSGNAAVSTAGVITFTEVTGLTAGTAYRISYTHSGTPA